MSCTVLRCHGCLTFQVHQQKKAKKWTCKMCNEKQSFVKVYAEGSGAECRSIVQNLNMGQRKLNDDISQYTQSRSECPADLPGATYNSATSTRSSSNKMVSQKMSSKWAAYLDPADHESPPNSSYSHPETDSENEDQAIESHPGFPPRIGVPGVERKENLFHSNSHNYFHGNRDRRKQDPGLQDSRVPGIVINQRRGQVAGPKNSLPSLTRGSYPPHNSSLDLQVGSASFHPGPQVLTTHVRSRDALQHQHNDYFKPAAFTSCSKKVEGCSSSFVRHEDSPAVSSSETNRSQPPSHSKWFQFLDPASSSDNDCEDVEEETG